MTRTIEMAGKALTYLLTALERPRELPRTIAAVAGGANPGHYLKLNWPWIRRSGIRTVLDVGAHKGEFSSAMRALLPDAMIYAFEPLPDCFALLTRRLGGNGHFRAFSVALGHVSDKLTLWRSRYPKSSSVLPMAELHKEAFPWTAESSPLSVEVKPLDEYHEQLKLAAKVLLKIDVQGYEQQVLQGAKEILKKMDYVLVEVSFLPLYEGQTSFAEIHAFLQAEGFSYAGNLEQLLSPLDGSILQADALFVRAAR